MPRPAPKTTQELSSLELLGLVRERLRAKTSSLYVQAIELLHQADATLRQAEHEEQEQEAER